VTFGVVCLACGCTGSLAAEEDPLPLPERTPRTAGEEIVTDASAPEASDAGAEAGDAAVDAARPLRVFVTSTTHPATFGGVVAADQICAARAMQANLTGTYRAWVSTALVDARDRVTSNGPWHLVDGTLVAETKAVLVSGTLRHGIDRDQNGAVPPLVEDRVWTGTLGNGRYSGASCNGWTVTAGGGSVGEAEQQDDDWTALVNEPCSLVNRLYCFEL
jgi:hypothetical protein